MKALAVKFTALFLWLLIVASKFALADDIAVYNSAVGSGPKPNILFVLDYSGSMDYDIHNNYVYPGGPPARIDLLREALAELFDLNKNTINAGISTFSFSSGGIKWPISDLDIDASDIDPSIPAGSILTRDVMKNIVNDLEPSGATATVAALTEAAAYFKGDYVTLGGRTASDIAAYEPGTWNTGQQVYTGGSFYGPNPVTYQPANAYQNNAGPQTTGYCQNFNVSGGPDHCWGRNLNFCYYVGATADYDAHQRCIYRTRDRWHEAKYHSPVNSCQSNYMVLISDGSPTALWKNPQLTDLIGKDTNGCEDLSSSIFGENLGDYHSGNCGPELVSELRLNDQIPSIPDSNVITYTIGFGAPNEGEKYLSRLADDGGGRFFAANRPQDLSNALNEILDEIVESSENFAEFAIDINKSTFSHDNRVFLPLFQPSNKQSWLGNVKGYFLEQDGIKDVNNAQATETTSIGTQFTETAQSFWSPSPDGREVEKGGASAKLPSTMRSIYTYTGWWLPPGGRSLATDNGRHDFATYNNSLRNHYFGSGTTRGQRNQLIDWLHNAPMGDPLHSKVVTVAYENQTVAYAATNQGLLHAFDATLPIANGDHQGGEEIFSFIPRELLPNLKALRANNSGGDHIYGLDGPITRWHDDQNNDGIVNGADTVLLIVGMRRGGNSYYALDVTFPNVPILKWQITGGQTWGFNDLAQSWSRMSLINVRRDGAYQTPFQEADTDRVLVFAGGYDAATLNDKTSSAPAKGGAIYMVDRNGKLIWSTELELEYSMPADLTIIDSDADGLADRLYGADLGGNIWRVDFDDVSNSQDFKLQHFAELGDSIYTPFFYGPSVSTSTKPRDQFLSVSIGSGNRDNPLLPGSQDQIYMLKDVNTKKGPPDTIPPPVQRFELFDATPYDLGSSDPAVVEAAQNVLDLARGWHLELAPGEKILSSLVTFQGNILATSFQPTEPRLASDGCTITQSVSRFYLLNSTNGNPVKSNFFAESPDTTNDLDANDRSTEIGYSGIPSTPVVVFPDEGGTVQIVVDKQVVGDIDQNLYRTLWYDLR